MRKRADGLTDGRITGRPREPGLENMAGLAALHLAVFAGASARGGLAPTIALGPPASIAFWDNAQRIASANFRALAVLVVAGVVLAGIPGLVVFALNGYLFGQFVVSSPAPIAWVWLYAPVELASFALAGAMAVDVASNLLAWLRDGVPVALRLSLAALGIAVIGLALASLLEATAIARAWGR
jgi:hypothetical protein